jgi:hypothetical protein
VTEPPLQAVEHQFLWPLGRIRYDNEETSHSAGCSRSGAGASIATLTASATSTGMRCSRSCGAGPPMTAARNYFAFFPLYADIPEFLTYDGSSRSSFRSTCASTREDIAIACSSGR